MELNSPWVLYIGIPVLIALCLIKFKKNKEAKDLGKKIANTEFVKETSYFKNLMKKYKILRALAIAFCALSVFFTLILIARPVEVQKQSKEEFKRDIFLCLDVSSSMDHINAEVSRTLKDMVKGLEGDRFGIVIFNSSACTVIPLTDDYEFVIQTLEALEASFSVVYDGTNIAEKQRISSFIENGTSERDGASIMSDGLVTCAFDFPDLDKERSRIIIFSTDNALNGDPIYTMDEATDVCKDKKIKVYAITPEYYTDEKGFTRAITKTGGKVYKTDSEETVSAVVKAIEKEERTKVDDRTIAAVNDKPQIPFVLLIISIISMLFINKKVGI